MTKYQGFILLYYLKLILKQTALVTKAFYRPNLRDADCHKMLLRKLANFFLKVIVVLFVKTDNEE